MAWEMSDMNVATVRQVEAFVPVPVMRVLPHLTRERAWRLLKCVLHNPSLSLIDACGICEIAEKKSYAWVVCRGYDYALVYFECEPVWKSEPPF